MATFADFKTHFRIVFESLTNPNEPTAVFFNVAGEVEGLGEDHAMLQLAEPVEIFHGLHFSLFCKAQLEMRPCGAARSLWEDSTSGREPRNSANMLEWECDFCADYSMSDFFQSSSSRAMACGLGKSA